MDDIWLRDQAGQISFERIFDDRTVVEYTAGELRTLGVTPCGTSWPDIRSGSLAKAQAQGRKAGVASYQGKLGEEQVKVEWLDESSLPRLLVRSAHGKSVRFTLLKQPAPCQRASWLRIGPWTTTPAWMLPTWRHGIQPGGQRPCT